MIEKITDFFGISAPKPPKQGETEQERATRQKKLQWSVFLSATLGYGIYYVCRLSLNVVKKPIVDNQIFTETELGVIGSVLFFTYAIGKFTNGFMADRSNIGRFMSLGLFISAIANLCLGFTNNFIFFAILWGINGWFQSMGAASCVVGLSRWFNDKQRGSFYGFWSASHNIGEALTFIVIASVVSAFGWRMGFISAGVLGILGGLIVLIFLYDIPQSKELPAINTSQAHVKSEDFSKAQKTVLIMPAIWILALSSAFMYISRYAVNSWGIFYLEAQKGYSTLDASFIISISSICGIIGTMFSGLISDKFFRGQRNLPALIFGIMNISALCLFLLVPGVHFWIDVTAMLLFGTSIGVLLCYLGGLMAVDIAPKNASGAALGVVGIASYIGAGIQDIVSGILIEGNKQIIDGKEIYDFTYINWFWIGAAVISTILALFVWNAQSKQEAFD
ncbi:MFS transporter [Ornithobacterium rhinotracheale]